MSESTNIEVMCGSKLGTNLSEMLLRDDIDPADDPSYQLFKTIYVYHPLGQKMAEAPITQAQSRPRTVTVQNAPEEVVKAFTDEWGALQADSYIHNVHSLARVYGI